MAHLKHLSLFSPIFVIFLLMSSKLYFFFLTLNSFTNKQTKTQNMHHAQGSLFDFLL